MSLQDVVNPAIPPPSPPRSRPPPDSISDPLIDDVSVPISGEIFDFCDDSGIFQDTLQSYEVTSSPNCCDYENPFQGDQNGSTTSSTTTTATTTTIMALYHHYNPDLPIIFDPQVDMDNDISASIDFTTTPTTLVDHITLSHSNGLPGLLHYCTSPVDPTATFPLVGVPPLGLGPVFEEDCLGSFPPFLRTSVSSSSSSSCIFLDPNQSQFAGSLPNLGLCTENSGIYGGSFLMGSELHGKELDFQGDQLGAYNSGDLQAFGNEDSQLLNGGTATSGPISTEISGLDDSTYKVGKLSVEQRKEKIHRYLKKRNERNFSKKIKYACRKTLADSRPRVRGRFARNDEFGEGHKHGHNDEDDYDEVGVKEEDDIVNSSELYAHINGINSFKCNYQIQSWI